MEVCGANLFKKTLALFFQQQEIDYVERDRAIGNDTASGVRRYLRAMDTGAPIDAMSLMKSDPINFMRSASWLYFDIIDYPFVPGFFRRLTDANIFVMELYLQNNYKKMAIKQIVEQVEEVVKEVPIYRSYRQKALDYLEEFEHAKSIPVLKQNYESHLDNYQVVKHRLPEIMSIVESIDEAKTIYAPGDGIGVVSVSCILLGRKYVSSEPNQVGDRAYKLGIITERSTAENFIPRVDKAGVVILSNLSLYCDLTPYIDNFQVVVLDEQVVYPGASKLIELPGSNGRIRCSPGLVVRSVTNYSDQLPSSSNRLDITKTMQACDGRAAKFLETRGAKVVSRQGSIESELYPVQEGDPVSYNFKNVTDPQTYVLSYRKKAVEKCGRPGQQALVDGYWYPFNGHYYYTVDQNEGFRKRRDELYFGRSILANFDLSEHPEGYVQVKFNPSKLRFAYYLGTLVRVMPTNIVSVGLGEFTCHLIRLATPTNARDTITKVGAKIAEPEGIG